MILGIDIGGTKTAVSVATSQAEILYKTVFSSRPERGFAAMFSELCDHIERSLEQYPQVSRIGVSVGGPIDAANGVILGPPHLPGWEHVPLKALLEERFKLTTHIEHDAKAGALAEWMFGAGRGANNLIFLTLGTGLGAGIITDGHLLSGRAGLAGEVGHWRMAADGPVSYGKSGAWEAFVSGSGLASLARYRHPDLFHEGTTAQDVNQQAHEGSKEARAVILESAEYLGQGLALLVDLLAPEVIILGSLAFRLGEDYTEAAKKAMQREVLSSHTGCAVVGAGLRGQIGDIAAISTVLYREKQ